MQNGRPALKARRPAKLAVALAMLGAAHVSCSSEETTPAATMASGSSSSSTSSGSSTATTSSTGTATSNATGTATGSGAGGSSSTGGAGGAPPFDASTAGPAAAFARKLGKTNFLVGLGPHEASYPPTGQLDIRYIYLVGNKDASLAWPKWNAPDGEYATIVANDARQHGAIPMFDIYEFAALGDGNYNVIRDATYMPRFWADLQLLADKLKIFDAPAIVHIEPDFLGYAQQNSPGGDPKAFMAQVKIAPTCGDLADDLTGFGACVMRIFRTTSPKTVVGFHGSQWAAYTNGIPDGAAVGRFVSQIAGTTADFISTDILDRDAGCFELQVSTYGCVRGVATGWYWDETNVTSPNFHEYLAWAKTLRDGAGLPILWWQTPMGEPSATAGGTAGHYRDNRVHYFFSHVREFIDAGGAGICFGAGASGQTSVGTDNGQFERLLDAYNKAPAPL